MFGSSLAIVPFLYGGIVTEHQWLNVKQFVDALAVAMITPGPAEKIKRIAMTLGGTIFNGSVSLSTLLYSSNTFRTRPSCVLSMTKSQLQT